MLYLCTKKKITNKDVGTNLYVIMCDTIFSCFCFKLIVILLHIWHKIWYLCTYFSYFWHICGIFFHNLGSHGIWQTFYAVTSLSHNCITKCCVKYVLFSNETIYLKHKLNCQWLCYPNFPLYTPLWGSTPKCNIPQIYKNMNFQHPPI